MFSQPTPEKLTWAEAAIFVFVLLSVSHALSLKRVLLALNPKSFQLLSILIILWWPYLGFLYFQNDESQAVRDIIAALFMVMFCFGLPKLDPHAFSTVSKAVFVAGLCFIARQLLEARDSLVDLGSRNIRLNESYLLQDVIVLYSVLYAISKLKDAIQSHNYIKGSIYCALIALGQIAFLTQALRLNMLISFSYFLFVLISVRGRIAKFVSIVVILYAINLIYSNIEVFGYFLEKLQKVGGNGKVTEFVDVAKYVFHNWNVAVLGKGFGGEFFSPTYGSNINFTHSLLSYLILKSGLIGLFYGIFIYIFWIYFGALSVRRNYKDLQILVLTLAPPFLTQPTYKSFSFGIIVWMFISLVSKLRNETKK